jgi:Rieske Fe-S protein
MTNPHSTTRRRFLGLLTNLLMLLIVLLVAVPAFAYFLAPLRRRGGPGRADFADAGPLSEIPVGKWRLVPLEVTIRDGWKTTRVRQAVWVRRTGEDDQAISVLSSICPHLGCPINWHPEKSQFVCPCHGGLFNADGRNIGGPPPRPMDPLEFEVRNNRLWVRWQDFKIGVSDLVPVRV